MGPRHPLIPLLLREALREVALEGIDARVARGGAPARQARVVLGTQMREAAMVCNVCAMAAEGIEVVRDVIPSGG